MKSRFLRLATLVFVVLGATVMASLSPRGGASAAGASGDEAVNLAVSVQGQATYKRPGWSNYAPVVFGTGIRIGDLLRVGSDSQMLVVCSDLTLHQVGPGVAGVPCPGSPPLLRRPEGSLINATRGSSARPYPQVLSPRKTKLLSEHPTLRWTSVKGTDTYVVIVRGPNLNWKTQVHDQTEVKYPTNAPPLEDGVDYKLIVEAGGQSSSIEPGLGLGFSLIGRQERKEILHAEKQIARLGLPAGPTEFLIAHLYAAHGLNAEAVEHLENISKSFNVAAVSHLLGDVYLTIGLIRQAEARYLNALELSKNERDGEGAMLVHFALGDIYDQALGNQLLAREHFDAALNSAKELGDEQATTEAKGRLLHVMHPTK